MSYISNLVYDPLVIKLNFFIPVEFFPKSACWLAKTFLKTQNYNNKIYTFFFSTRARKRNHVENLN